MIKEKVYSLLKQSKNARDDPKFLEWYYLTTEKIIDPITVPFWKYRTLNSIESVLRVRRKLIETGDILIDEQVEINRREREEFMRDKYSR
jgi:hypothetical protein|tara:strand:- start:60 stop:329 length:270 start_codon:yes stop_codon:yes gene_type:complete